MKLSKLKTQKRKFVNSTVMVLMCLLTVGNAFTQNLLNGPESIVFDTKNECYFVSNWENGTIVRIGKDNVQKVFKSGLTHCAGLLIADSLLYVANKGKITVLNLANAEVKFEIAITGAKHIDDITIDTSGHVYATDWQVKRVFKVDIKQKTSSVFVQGISYTPLGILFDKPDSRLILLAFGNNVPIRAVNITTGAVSTIKATNFKDLDDIVRDNKGNYYITAWGTNTVYKFDRNFSKDPETVSSGHKGPAGLAYNEKEDLLAITNYNAKTIDFVSLANTAVHTEKQMVQPNEFELFQNYPNPFNPDTIIQYALKHDGYVHISIYNSIGQKTRILVNERQKTGVYSILWDGADQQSQQSPSGTYFCKLTVGKNSVTRKLIKTQ